ncbi:MAG: transketolase C-terminal domain-containing protein, partial [Minisyncoccia bacterium]
ATVAAADLKKPVYIRLAREKTPVITTDDSPFEIGIAQIVFGDKEEKADVGIIATGALLYRALKVANELEKEGKKVKVLNVSTIKPIDSDAVVNIAKTCGAVVTVEEHQIIGGLGSAVSEVIAQNFPVPQEFIGVHDKFGQSGTQDELLEHYGMSEKDIKDACLKVIKRK